MYLVKCSDYNGLKNVLFMMKPTDRRCGTKEYRIVTDGKFNRRTKTFSGTNGRDYLIYADWSAQPKGTKCATCKQVLPRHHRLCAWSV